MLLFCLRNILRGAARTLAHSFILTVALSADLLCGLFTVDSDNSIESVEQWSSSVPTFVSVSVSLSSNGYNFVIGQLVVPLALLPSPVHLFL